MPLAQARTRLDQFIAATLAPEYSRARVARMIKAGLVRINGSAARAAVTVHPGDQVELDEPAVPQPLALSADAPTIDVLFADDELIVVNKPAGLTVHHAPGHPHSTLVDGLLAHFPELAAMTEPDGVMRPGIVHRLDKDTSGVMVVARTPFARTALAGQFKERTVRKFYIALVMGVLAHDRITIDRPIGRHPTERKRMSVSSRNPRTAVSHVWALRRWTDLTLVGVRPETGRTHQIRVHLASIGHPCVGDAVYGRRQSDMLLKRQALHAFMLEVDHPRTGRRHAFRAPLPSDLDELLIGHGIRSFEEIIAPWLIAEGAQHRGSVGHGGGATSSMIIR